MIWPKREGQTTMRTNRRMQRRVRAGIVAIEVRISCSYSTMPRPRSSSVSSGDGAEVIIAAVGGGAAIPIQPLGSGARRENAVGQNVGHVARARPPSRRHVAPPAAEPAGDVAVADGAARGEA